MSRNFELMQKIQEGDVALPFAPDAELLAIHQPNAPSESRWRKEVRLEPLADRLPGDEEILNLVNSIFPRERLPWLEKAVETPRLVVFSDADLSGGSSTICARTGEVLASQPRIRGRVCLVDANLHSPSFHERFDLPARAGLTDAIVEEAPIGGFVQQVGASNLWVLLAGSLRGTPLALDPARLRSRMDELRREFDFVLVDAPAADLHPEAVLLGQMADGLVLVIEANSTRRDSARRVKQTVELADVRLLGAVLNNRRFEIPEPIYSRL